MEKLRVLNRNQLKTLGIIMMFLDHFAQISYESSSWIYIVLRMVARITFPLMVYFLVEGFCYTKDLKKYIARLFVFSIISLFTYSFFETGSLLPLRFVRGAVVDCSYSHLYLSKFGVTVCFYGFSVITNLLFCLLTLTILEKTNWNIVIKVFLIGMMFMVSFICDWLYIAILFTLIFYYFRNNKNIKWLLYFIVSIIYLFNFGIATNVFDLSTYINIKFVPYRVGMVFAPILIEVFYSGKAGRDTPMSKWFFYIFYPVHHFILGIIALLK